jgi:hypothetical protein
MRMPARDTRHIKICHPVPLLPSPSVNAHSARAYGAMTKVGNVIIRSPPRVAAATAE